jgi:hypothetical protein
MPLRKRLPSEYVALSIISTTSKPQQSTPLMAAGVLIAAGAALLFVLGQ